MALGLSVPILSLPLPPPFPPFLSIPSFPFSFTSRGAFNLALLAANLAESAGPSAIAHSLRAEIYLCAAVRSRLCLPKCVRRVVAAYFFRRAKYHNPFETLNFRMGDFRESIMYKSRLSAV